MDGCCKNKSDGLRISKRVNTELNVSSTAVKLSAENLRDFISRLFEAAGVSSSDSAAVAESLVESNLCGHESHGVMRVREYVDQLHAGELKPGVDWTVHQETDSLLVADANLGFGQVQMRRLIDSLAPKAERQGIACGALRRCGHVGRLGEWVQRVASRGLAALMSVNDNGVLQCVAPPGGTAPRISTNPMAIGVPTSGEPLVLDISTSAVANGKIQVAALAGAEVPQGWIQDADGRPTTDPHTRFADPPGTLLPMGGETGFKGFGLGMFLDLLVGGLCGGSCPPAGEAGEATNNALIVVWHPGRFHGSEHLVGEAAKLVDYVRSTPLKSGVDSIRLPGDRSRELRAARLRDGVPLDDGTWDSLHKLAEGLNVQTPVS